MMNKLNFIESTAFSSGVCQYLLQAERGYCVVMPGFLSGNECDELLADGLHNGYVKASSDYPKNYRNNDRQIRDDQLLASQMKEKLKGLAPEIIRDGQGEPWKFESVNERFRLCRYLQGQRFNIHQDGVHYRGKNVCSRLTFLLYLNGNGEFRGGDTVFYSKGPANGEVERQSEIARVQPERGTLVLFDHDLWHAGEEVDCGTKYIIRSDLLYRRVNNDCEANASEQVNFSNAHEGYIWSMLALDHDKIASGGRDGSIRVWNEDGVLTAKLLGHQQSVLGMARIDANRIASVSRDRTMKIWDLQRGACVASIKTHEAAVLDVVALPDQSLVTSSADGTIKIWDERLNLNGELVGHTGWVWALANLGNGLIASASDDSTIKIWDGSKRTLLDSIRLDAALQCLCVCSDGMTLLAGTTDGFIEHLEFRDTRLFWKSRYRAHSAAVRRIRVVEEGFFASAGEDNLVKLWKRDSWKELGRIGHENFATDIVRSKSRYLSCSYDGTILQTSLELERELHEH